MDDDFSSVIIESMSDGVVVVDFRGRIIHMNPAGADLLGLRPEDVKGRLYGELFLGVPENDAFNDILIQGIQEKETRLYREASFMRKDGRQLDLAVTTSFLRTEAGKWATPGIVVVFKDITEFKALDRARRRVLDHLSHELKTPLSIINGSIAYLETPDNQKPIDRIRRNLKRLEDIQVDVQDIVRTQDIHGDHRPRPCVEQTLDLLELLAEEAPQERAPLDAVKRMVSERFPYERPRVQAFRLVPVIERVKRMASALSSHRDVRLYTDVRADPSVLMDETVGEKILMSLIKNGVENTPDEGSIHISLHASADGVRLMVRDTGVGITEESQKQIFGGFYHARETDFYSTKRPFDFDAGGKGLELLKVRMFAETYDFQVACDSTRCFFLSGEDTSCPGVISRCPHVQDEAGCARSGGTTFTLDFPVAEGFG